MALCATLSDSCTAANHPITRSPHRRMMTRIVESVLVDEDRGKQSSELDQTCDIRGRCGRDAKPRSPARHRHCCADRPDQTIAAGSGGSAARAAKIVINDLDASPAELTGEIVAEA